MLLSVAAAILRFDRNDIFVAGAIKQINTKPLEVARTRFVVQCPENLVHGYHRFSGTLMFRSGPPATRGLGDLRASSRAQSPRATPRRHARLLTPRLTSEIGHEQTPSALLQIRISRPSRTVTRNSEEKAVAASGRCGQRSAFPIASTIAVRESAVRSLPRPSRLPAIHVPARIGLPAEITLT